MYGNSWISHIAYCAVYTVLNVVKINVWIIRAKILLLQNTKATITIKRSLPAKRILPKFGMGISDSGTK